MSKTPGGLSKMYKRPIYTDLIKRLKEKRLFIQVLAGPRQVGKTTLIQQVLSDIDIPSHFASADDVPNRSSIWLEQQWEIARLKTKTSKHPQGFILVIDEIQKINGWTETVKKLWDRDTRQNLPVKTVILGSSPLLLQKGLEESLGGRFELLRCTHWPFREMKEAFDFSFEQFVYFGGYPGTVALVPEEKRWKNYVKDALIETTISKDVLMMSRVDKPALLRQLFEVGCLYSGQILSFNKMIGQLQDAGNTTTISHYLRLLTGAGMLAGIDKFSKGPARGKSSSPKLQVLNNALLTAQSSQSFEESLLQPQVWGRLVESAVGSHLLNSVPGTPIQVYYWREKNLEVDFVLRKGDKLAALEVKSGIRKEKLLGLELFCKTFPGSKPFLIGSGGLSPEEFFQIDLNHLV